MQDISGFGLRIIVTASVTFPNGLTLTQFADDADPLDSPAITLAEAAMGLNGDMITWSKPNVIPAIIALVPNSDDAINMDILADANRVARGKRGSKDVIDLQIVYPDGTVIVKTRGAIVSAQLGLSVASAGRMKSKVYGFMFEDALQ